MDRSTPSSAVWPSWGDSSDRASSGPKPSNEEARIAMREIGLLRAEGGAPCWLNAVVGTGQALCLVSGPVMFATRIWVIALLALVGLGVMLLGQKGITERRRRYFDDPASGRTIALVLEELPDAIAARVVDQHRRWRACRLGDPVTLFLLNLWTKTASDEYIRSQPPTVGERVVVRAQDRAFEEVGAAT